MREKLTLYDPAEGLLSNEAIEVFMEEAFKTNDVAYIVHAIGVVARARGMPQAASELSEDGNPTLKTTIAVMKALGLELTAKVHADTPVSA